MESKIRQVIQERMGLATPPIDSEADLRNELGMDSLHMVELVVELERAFCLRITEEEAAGFRKVGDLSRYIGRRMARV
jgi:acyl carrier protein